MKKILVVDDNVVNLKFVDKMLKSNEEYKPVLVPSGSKALQFLSKNVPVLFLTAEEDEGLQERIKTVGAQGFLLKPFKQDALLKLVGQYLA